MLMRGVAGNTGRVATTVVALEHPETGSKAVSVYVPFCVAIAGLGELVVRPGPFQVN